MEPFSHNKFLGYVSEVTPQFIKIQFPTANLLQSFYHDGNIYAGGNVGCFVVIEGAEYGFLGRIIELNLPQGERTEITEKTIHEANTDFHPIGKIELRVVFNVYNPLKIEKTISKYPAIGSKIYSCSDEQISNYISAFGAKSDNHICEPFSQLGKLTSNNAVCNISLNSLFGRHCAVVGTTGGGKSWTVAKLLEMMNEHTSNNIILIDATGEYENISNNVTSIKLGDGEYIFDYTRLTIDELYYLLKPSSKTQVPKLMDAIRSLKIANLSSDNNLSGLIENGIVRKSGNNKRPYEAFYYRNITAIEDKYCNFNFELLPRQITSECIWDTDKNDVNKWGGRNETDVSNCISLISRVNNLLCTEEYNKIFGFRKSALNAPKDLIHVIDDYIRNKKGLLRFDFSNVSFDYQVREILVNAIGKYLLNNAREGKFKNDPVVIFIDEAHQFLNKSIKDEYFDAKPLDSFELISKEARKYGLFLCIATQMPRDIPLGTLSQMGTFIVHRLINDQDKKAIESAASSANKNILSFLPILGEGEALLVGVDFPMPLLLKVDAPNNKPNSQTPKFTIKDK